MEEDKFKDLLEDEELTALRLAALASKKKADQNENENSSEVVSVLPINSIVTSTSASESASSQIPFVQTDRNVFNNNYSWRKQNQSLRRRGGGFTKNNNRSNLIVISPISINDGKSSEEKAPALILPQHKWCNSGNEESLSPKTLRKTGPTRFNRHGSDSESSDDSDNERSDNDSGSNETVLQDEPPENFTHVSSGCDTVSSSIEKKRRLSFQNLDSGIKPDTFDKNETSSVYNVLKNSSYIDKPDNYTSVQNLNESQQTWSHSVEEIYSNYNQYNSKHGYPVKTLDHPDNFVAKQTNSSVIGNGESFESGVFITQSSEVSNTWQQTVNKTGNLYYSKDPEKSQLHNDIHGLNNSVWQHDEGLRINNPFYSSENVYSSNDSRNYQDDNTKSHSLSKDDLRLELKKRMQEMKSQPTSNEIEDSKKYCQNSTWDKSKQKYTYEEDKTVDISCVNAFGDKQKSSNLEINRHKRSCSRDSDDENLSSFNWRKHQRSLSRERNTHEGFTSRGKSKFDYRIAAERNRYDQDRSRCDQSFSLDKQRHEHSSSQDMSKNENTKGGRRNCSSSPTKKKNEHSFGQDKDKHADSFRQSRNYDDPHFTEDKKREGYKFSQKGNRSERSPSNEKNMRDHSSSSDSRHEHSLNRDRDKNKLSYYSSRSKNKKDYNSNRNKCRDRRDCSPSDDSSRHERSSDEDRSDRSTSRDRQRYKRSHSYNSRLERSQSQERRRYSSSEDPNNEHDSGHDVNRHKNSFRSTFRVTKCKSSQEKNRQCASNQGMLENCKSDYSPISENVREDKLKKTCIKEQSNSVEWSRLKCSSSSNENKERNKKSFEKYTRLNDSSYKNCYSRTRSRSSESYSSSYSSSSSHSSKPEIRSVPSVIKTVPTKKLDTENRDTVCETKSVVKNMNSAVCQSDDFPISTKKGIDVGNYKFSTPKCAHMDGDLKAPDNTKRVPVHMRLGVFPRKRVIQMAKDVEAAFVNSSSSSDGENINSKCKRQNIRIVTDVCDAKGDLLHQKHSPTEKSTKQSSDIFQEKFKRLKTHR